MAAGLQQLAITLTVQPLVGIPALQTKTWHTSFGGVMAAIGGIIFAAVLACYPNERQRLRQGHCSLRSWWRYCLVVLVPSLRSCRFRHRGIHQLPAGLRGFRRKLRQRTTGVIRLSLLSLTPCSLMPTVQNSTV